MAIRTSPFALPVAGLSGRGINAGLSLVYNSAVWNKSTAPLSGATWMTYDVDASWPATGWRMTLGQIENQGSAGYTLVDADGTRHALSLTSTSHYDTSDGTFIHYHGGSTSGTLYYRTAPLRLTAPVAAQTTYSYPTTAQALTDVPAYSTRTDDWAGRTTSMSGGVAPYYTFATNESTGVSTVTAPDLTITETHSIVNAGQWNDGLVSDTYIKDASTTYAQTHIDWQLDANNKNPRPYQILTTDSLASLTKATVLSYTTYNNVSSVSERDFTSNGTVSSTELRRTETTYVTDSIYIGRRLYHLPASVKVYPGGSSTPISRIDYTYDNYGTNHADLTARPNIIMHDPAYDPFQEDQETCDWVCQECGINETGFWGCLSWEWECTYFNPYLGGTDYRGNVTSTTTYSDAATPSGSNNSCLYLRHRRKRNQRAGRLLPAQVFRLFRYLLQCLPDFSYAWQSERAASDFKRHL